MNARSHIYTHATRIPRVYAWAHAYTRGVRVCMGHACHTIAIMEGGGANLQALLRVKGENVQASTCKSEDSAAVKKQLCLTVDSAWLFSVLAISLAVLFESGPSM